MEVIEMYGGFAANGSDAQHHDIKNEDALKKANEWMQRMPM